MRNDGPRLRWSAPRLIGGAVAALGVLVLILVYSTGAAAVVGDTDLSLTKSDSPDPVVEDGTLTYTIKVQNLGANDASNVTVTDDLPSQVDFVSASGGCKGTGHKVNCDLGTISASTTRTVTIVVKAKKAGAISNTAEVASPQDTNPTNNRDTEATLVVKAGKPSCASPTIAGTPGDDLIVGTPGRDVIASYGGNDRVYGKDGKDLICAGAGADLVNGGPGDDIIKGGKGPDRLKGRGGNDLIEGKAGRDRLWGGKGNDRLIGGRGRDKCKGGPGHDILKSCP